MTTSRTRTTSSGGQTSSSTTGPDDSTDSGSDTGSGTGTTKAAKKTTKKSGGSAGSSRKRASAPRAEARPRLKGPQAAAEGARQLLQLTGKAVEGITALERSEDGWTVQVEVVEMRRIPDTTDVLALYELDVDEQGALDAYRRVRRYVRGTPGEE